MIARASVVFLRAYGLAYFQSLRVGDSPLSTVPELYLLAGRLERRAQEEVAAKTIPDKAVRATRPGKETVREERLPAPAVAPVQGLPFRAATTVWSASTPRSASSSLLLPDRLKACTGSATPIRALLHH